MSRETAVFVIAQMEKTFRRNFPRKGLEDINAALLKEPAKAIEAAGDHFAIHSAFLPSAAIFLAKVQAEGKRIRSEQTVKAERDEKAKETWSDGTALERAARDEHAKFALQGINLQRRSDKTDAEKLEFFRIMEDRYPGRGWGMAGVGRQKEMEREGKRSHWRDISETSPQFQRSYQLERERKGLE